ncbi:MAG: shikimate dehydrogenase [Candidatus Peregrinibacteria bacterium]|nr:shikimate dehydrogenase [Candidatus Peregrinibacteria bacterium]MDZ4244317.1 shikimate dehydrogenase [Candidatus Gracilibacteria bacterium]
MEKIFGILAYPAWHSLSPVMHLEGFKELELPYGFDTFDVKPEELRDFMGALKRRESVELSSREFDLSKVEGFSVSMPHKEMIIPLLDGLDDAGHAVGAVSCVYMQDGKFIGTNLDYMGVKGSLQASDYASKQGLSGKKVIVIGAGGAAKAAVYGLLQLNMIPVLFNRTVDKALEIADQFSMQSVKLALQNKERSNNIKIDSYSIKELENGFEDVEIIINCTSLGLEGDEKIVPDSVFSHIKLSLDAVYSHEPTIFQAQSVAAGAENLTGLEWLLHQGYEAFKIWTGKDAPQDAMRAAVSN